MKKIEIIEEGGAYNRGNGTNFKPWICKGIFIKGFLMVLLLFIREGETDTFLTSN